MAIPPGFDPAGLAPRILIFNESLQLQYTYEHPNIDDNPTQDFVLDAWQIMLGINSNAGSCQLTIEDHTDNLTRPDGSLIMRAGWHIQVLLGKNAAGLSAWFFGIINEPRLERPGYGQQLIQLSAYGYSHSLSSRYISIEHKQARDPNTNRLNQSDDTAKISELVKLVFASKSMLIPPPDPNLTINGIEDIDVKLSSLQKQNQSQGIVISELANVVNAIYGVSAERDFFFHTADKHSGFVITNDLNDDTPNGDKLMLIRNQPYSYVDTTIRKAYTSLIGLDVTESRELMGDGGGTTEQGLTGNHWLGYEIPFKGKIDGSLEILMTDASSYAHRDAPYFLYEGSGSLFDGVYPDDLPRVYAGIISKDKLDDLSATPTYVSIPIRAEPTTQNKRVLWMRGFISGSNDNNGVKILEKNTGSNKFYINVHSSGDNAGSINEDTSTDITGTTGTGRIRYVEDTQTLIKAQNLELRNRFATAKEQIQYLPDTPPGETAATIFEGLLQQAGRARRIYKIPASVPNTRPPLGQQVRFIDTHNGIDTNPMLISYKLSANRQQQLVCITMDIEAELYL